MPGKVKVKIIAGRQLPIMDRSSDTTDAFAEVKLGDTTYKTDVCRKSLNPSWNSEWFRFDVDDLDLQDEPLQIRVMDYDTYSANDAIGKVYVDLNPLLINHESRKSEEGSQPARKGSGNILSGWFPIFDTIHGVRGEVNIQVKVELFYDHNKFRQSSCGVPFFFSPSIPEGYQAQYVNGFVEELVVNDDPEYQWIDKIRTPRASNEARQTLFMKLSGAVQRKIGLKAIELGGNAVVGYQQKFDLEGDSGIVVRGIGTAVTIVKVDPASKEVVAEVKDHDIDLDSSTDNLNGLAIKDSDIVGHSLKEASGSYDKGSSGAMSKATNKLLHEAFELLEYPFITLKKFPQGFITRFGGLVSCRSVKLLEGPDEEDVRDGWWTEIRREIRSHAKALGCNLIVGYSEDTVISEDIVVLCASGTAALGNLSYILDLESNGIFGPPFVPGSSRSMGSTLEDSERPRRPSSPPSCSAVHLPYNDNSLPFACRVSLCKSCHKGRVPDVLFTTVEPPSSLGIQGRGCLLQAKVIRLKKDLKAENNAKEISDGLPFVEYEIHRQLINKLKVKGMNGLFGLKTKLSIGERTIVAVATATAAYISALPSPSRPRLVTSTPCDVDKQRLQIMQQRLEEKVVENAKYYGINDLNQEPEIEDDEVAEDGGLVMHDYESQGHDVDLGTGNKDTCVLEIDDTEDADIVDSLMDQFPPANIQSFSTEELLGVAPEHIVRCSQTFFQIWRGKIHPSSRDLAAACKKLLSTVYFKLRRLRPCIVCQLDFKVDLNDENELQLSINGTAISLAHSGKTRKQLADVSSPEVPPEPPEDKNMRRVSYYVEEPPPHVVQLTPLSFVPGAKVVKYLGNLNFFLIRETSSLREVGGLSSFVQSFILEIYSIVRSHVAALGGNAIVSYFTSEFVVMHSLHKNQAQCLIHVGGDAVKVAHVPYVQQQN